MAVAVKLLVGLGFQGLGLLLYIIGLATPEWFVMGDVSYGLWKRCTAGVCVDIPSAFKELLDGKYEASEALAIIGMLAAAASVVAIGLFILLPMLGRSVTVFLLYLSALVAIFAVFSIFISAIIWFVIDFDTIKGSHPGYSFALILLGVLSLLFGACWTIVAARQMVTLT